jgi:hypothetical protein
MNNDTDDTEQEPDHESLGSWDWLENIKHRQECNQCEHAYYVRSENAWYCTRKYKLSEGYCEF